MVEELEQEILTDLTAELSSDSSFDASLLEIKIKNAIREVKRIRGYPNYYTEDQISNDMHKYYSNIRNVALYDYNQSGVEFQTSHSENSVSRGWMDRNKLFNGIITITPL